MQIDAEHIQRWMSQHESVLVNREVSAEFECYLESQPWAPSRLDWASIEHVEFSMSPFWEHDIGEFATRTPLGRHSHVIFMYSGSEPSLAGLTGDALRDVDLVYSGSPGARYFCGADMISGALVPTFEDFAEFDGISAVFFRI